LFQQWDFLLQARVGEVQDPMPVQSEELGRLPRLDLPLTMAVSAPLAASEGEAMDAGAAHLELEKQPAATELDVVRVRTQRHHHCPLALAPPALTRERHHD